MTTDYPSKGQRNAFRGLRKDEGTTFSASCSAVPHEMPQYGLGFTGC